MSNVAQMYVDLNIDPFSETMSPVAFARVEQIKRMSNERWNLILKVRDGLVGSEEADSPLTAAGCRDAIIDLIEQLELARLNEMTYSLVMDLLRMGLKPKLHQFNNYDDTPAYQVSLNFCETSFRMTNVMSTPHRAWKEAHRLATLLLSIDPDQIPDPDAPLEEKVKKVGDFILFEGSYGTDGFREFEVPEEHWENPIPYIEEIIGRAVEKDYTLGRKVGNQYVKDSDAKMS